MGRALGQAHLLVGRSFMATDKAEALDHARQSLEWDPLDVDARVFLADALMTAGEWGERLTEYEAVLAAGKDLRAEVSLHYKNAGVVALAQGHRELALSHFLRARALGLDDAGLGTGARVLEDEAASRLEAALAAVSEDGPARARELVEEALRLSPDDPRADLVEASILVREAGELLEGGSAEGVEERLTRASRSTLARSMRGCSSGTCSTRAARSPRPRSSGTWSSMRCASTGSSPNRSTSARGRPRARGANG